MEKVWKIIEKNLQKIAPGSLQDLNKGVSEDEISELEELIGAELPEDFVEFYKIHNGLRNDGILLIYGEELLSFERISDEWKIWKDLLDSGDFEDVESDPEDGIKKDWWNPLWIPFTYDGSGNHYCLDLDPEDGGNFGQIIRMWHDDSERTLEAESFSEFVENFAKMFDNGELVYSPDYFGIVPKEDLED